MTGTLPTGRGTPDRGLHRRLTLNSISNVLRYVASVGITFFLTPIVLRSLGDSVYGVWVVILSVMGYAAIFELGVQPAMVKFIGQHRNDPEKLSELVRAGFLFFSLLGLLTSVLFLIFLPHLIPNLVRDTVHTPYFRVALALMAVDILVLFVNRFFAGVLYGVQFYHAKNMIDIASWVMNGVLVLTLVTRGGLLALAVAKTITDVLALIATMVIARRVLPEIVSSARVGRRSFVDLFGFGGRIFMSATTTRLAAYGYPLIISSRLSSSATTFFSIPSRLAEYSREIGSALATGFMPMFSELESRKQHDLLRMIYLRYSRYILLVTAPLWILILVYGRPFIAIWLGSEYAAQARWPLVFLVGAAIADGAQPLLWRLFLGVGRVGFPVAVSVTCSLLSLVFAFLLAHPFGISGVTFSIFITTLAAQLINTQYSCSYLQLSWPQLFMDIHLRPYLSTGMLFFVLTGFSRWLGTDTYWRMAMGTLGGLLIYAALVFLIGLRPDERRWVMARFFSSPATSAPQSGPQ